MANSSGPRAIPLHQSLIRPLLLGGGERTLTLINGVISGALIFGIGSWQAAVFGLFFAVAVQWMLVKMAKTDTQLFDVFKRSIAYQKYYPAQAHFSAPPANVKYFVK